MRRRWCGAAESVLRELVAGRTFADLLTSDREAFQTAALHRLRERCQDKRLGVRLEGLSLTDLHPPQEVVDAYHQVTTAMENATSALTKRRARPCHGSANRRRKVCKRCV